MSFSEGLASLEPLLATAYPSPPYSNEDMTSPDMMKMMESLKDDVSFAEAPMVNDLLIGNQNSNSNDPADLDLDQLLNPTFNYEIPEEELNLEYEMEPMKEVVNDKEVAAAEVKKPVVSAYSLRREPRKAAKRESRGKTGPTSNVTITPAIQPQPFYTTIKVQRNRTSTESGCSDNEMPKREVNRRKRSAEKNEDEEYDNLSNADNKAAIQARINRQKKKAYVQGLEEQVGDLSEENSHLKTDNVKLGKDKASLEQEVAYLKSVLANQSMLSGLLNNINNTRGVKFTTSFNVERDAARDHDYGKPSAKKARKGPAPMSSGVCLHVDNENVSLEFCSSCAQMAVGGGRKNQS